MGIRLPDMMLHAKHIIRRRSHSKHQCSYQTSSAVNVPKGHFAVYVGDEEKNKRFVVPISYLKHPLFQALLSRAEEEFGFDCPVGGLMVPCAEDEFINLTSRINQQA
ncbi:Small auxin-up RNA - like 10 [Theobroma cacao]|uniref:Auxin-responsive protein SAUR21 n=2 Tax=Theobroma cacao TaxID=3641 RepID=A0AB32VSQ3_THECC|nr:PREDICTED: auxin-responsive protein SAUR21 [Theobroma cacao]EOX97794.1 SAUR family protein [Theobroma cacao]WRX14836.1 Small auxin-up RNA - like 10 [Theobroma cacao]